MLCRPKTLSKYGMANGPPGKLPKTSTELRECARDLGEVPDQQLQASPVRVKCAHLFIFRKISV